MKKGTYINIYVIMACLSGKKAKAELHIIDELLSKICAGCSKEYRDCQLIHREGQLVK